MVTACLVCGQQLSNGKTLCKVCEERKELEKLEKQAEYGDYPDDIVKTVTVKKYTVSSLMNLFSSWDEQELRLFDVSKDKYVYEGTYGEMLEEFLDREIGTVDNIKKDEVRVTINIL